MKKFLIISILVLFTSTCFAEDEVSQQATAFYNDKNHNKTMELLLQVEESKRSSQDWLLLGNLFEEKGDPQQALYMYQKAIEANKKFYKAYFDMAIIQTNLGNIDSAIEYYKKAIKYNKKNPYTHYNLGCLYIMKAQLKSAKTEFQQAITLKNDVPEFHYNLAFVYKELQEKKLAETYLKNYNQLLLQQGINKE